jgi:hypothetical protein
MRNAFLGATVACAAAMGLISAAVAAPQQATAAPSRLSTTAAVGAYLRSLGIDPAGVVIQRGSKNYAGPRCPGRDWNCTTARRVMQIAAGPGTNSFSCTPAGGGTSPPNTCVIVQSATTADNVAACKIAGSSSGVTQSCTVTQTNVSGTNRLELKEELTLEGDATSGTQVATVQQNNGSGSNVVALTQRSAESVSSNAASVSWSQSASQSFTIDQQADTGTNSVETSQTVSQTQNAPNATDGTQSQLSDQQAQIDQFSHGLSTMKAKQIESQSQTANAGVDQTQSGPQDCCSSQADNPANTASVKQQATQSQIPGGSQTEEQTVTYASSGNVSGTQTTTQDGTTSTNTFSGSTVSEQQGCTDGTCDQTPPPPPPPANWTQFNWTGGDGAPVNENPIAVTAVGPVVFSVTDAFCRGDRFTVSEGATTLGTTSVPGSTGCTPGDTEDPAVAFADPTYSSGTFALASGGHSLDIVVSTSPFGGGAAFYSVDPMTPAHCTDGRWATFTSPAFTSEADCFAFVGT